MDGRAAMTDDRFDQLVAFARRWAVPPSQFFPNGLGIDIRVVDDLADSPRLVHDPPRRVEMTRADYADLTRRVRVRALM